MALIWLSLGLAAQTSHYTLSLDGDSFLVSNGSGIERVPIHPEDKPTPRFVAYRKDDNFAVWDSRGLTLRKGSRTKSFRLENVPVSPLIFEPEEIESAQHESSEGKRSLAAAGLSGSRRMGQRVFFLLRWDDQNHHPAFEALIQVDLDAAEMKPTLLGKFDGVTGSDGLVGDRLFMINGGVGAVAERASDWGVATYSFATKSFDFVSLGKKLDGWYPSGLYTETTPYGTKVGGQLDRESLQATHLFENRGEVDWLDGELPPIFISRKADRTILRDCESGMEQDLSAGAQIRRVKDGLLAWSPAENPKHAVLLGYSRWKKLAAWNAGVTTQRPRTVHDWQSR